MPKLAARGPTIRISDEVLFRDLEGEAVLLDLRSQRYFGLDEVGTRIWQLLLQHGEEASVLETLLEEFEVSQEVLAQDLASFITRLRDAGLISMADSKAG